MSSEASPRIPLDEVRRIAKLANLDLPADEAERMARDLGQILAYVEQLREVDVTDVPPMAHVGSEGIVPRADEEAESFSQEIALREAPSVEEGGFRVPAYVDEG